MNRKCMHEGFTSRLVGPETGEPVVSVGLEAAGRSWKSWSSRDQECSTSHDQEGDSCETQTRARRQERFRKAHESHPKPQADWVVAGRPGWVFTPVCQPPGQSSTDTPRSVNPSLLGAVDKPWLTLVKRIPCARFPGSCGFFLL